MSESVTFYSYEQYGEFQKKLFERCNGKGYYPVYWQGFVNYHNLETDERLGYEVMQAGYYLINKE